MNHECLAYYNDSFYSFILFFYFCLLFYFVLSHICYLHVNLIYIIIFNELFFILLYSYE